MEIILTHIFIKCGSVDPDVYWIFNRPDYSMVLPFYDVEVAWGCAVPCMGAVYMDR